MREYGIQMYSVRDITEKDMPGALRALAEMGYKNVEFAGFFGIPAEEIKKLLDDNGLKVSGTHTGWNEIALRGDRRLPQGHRQHPHHHPRRGSDHQGQARRVH